MKLLVTCKKRRKSDIALIFGGLEGAEDLEITGYVYMRVDILFDSNMTVFFQGNNIEEILPGFFLRLSRLK